MFAGRRRLDCPKYDQLVQKKNAKSLVWEYFGLPADNNSKLVTSNVAVCKVCNVSVSAKSGSTTNLTSHLKIYHPLLFSKIYNDKKHLQLASTSLLRNECETISMPQTENAGKNSNSVNVNPLEKRQKTMHDFQPLDGNLAKQCTESVAQFIVGTLQPYSVVESHAFTKMIKTLNPRYKIPSRKYFSNTAIPKLYNETIEKIKSDMSLVQVNNIAITTDCWTSVANTPYIAITAHFIDEQWNLKSVCLACGHFIEDHTSENIAEVVTEILSNWNLNAKELSTCTTDNGANVVKAASLLNVPHVPCFGHSINIGVNKALQIPVISKAVARLKKLQNTIAHSWKLARDFKEAQKLLQMEVVSLPSACVTRWWSILKLCRRFLDNQLPLCKLLQDHPAKKHLMLENNEVKALEELLSATKLLEEITNNLSGEEYTTISSVLPLLRKIRKGLQVIENDSNLQREIKTEILSSLNRYEEIELMTLLRLSTFCDPRFRLNYVDNAEEIKRIVLERMSSLYDIEESKLLDHQVIIEQPKRGLEKLLEDDDDETKYDDDSFPIKKAEMELKHYLYMPKVGLNENPLTWWKSNGHNFPIIKTLSKKYLAIQGSSVPSERVFSTGGNVITRNRASLLPKNSEMLVFLFQNKKFT